MNTIFKTLILLSACSFCLGQLPWSEFGQQAIDAYLTGPVVQQYYTWWNHTNASFIANASFLYSCYVDFRNVTSASQGCTAALSQNDPNGNCYASNISYIAPVNFLQLANDAYSTYGVSAYYFTYSGDPDNASYSGAVYETLNTTGHLLNFSTYASCNETTTSSYTSTYGDGQLFAGIFQQIVTINRWYLEVLSQCIGAFPSPSQAQALYADVLDEFYTPLLGLLQNHATSPTAAPPTLNQIFNSPWALGGTRYGKYYGGPQRIIFDDLLSNWISGGNTSFSAPC